MASNANAPRDSGNITYLRGLVEAVEKTASNVSESLTHLTRARSEMVRAQSERDHAFRNMEHVRAELRYMASVLDAAERWYIVLANNASTDEQVDAASDELFHAIHRWIGATL